MKQAFGRTFLIVLLARDGLEQRPVAFQKSDRANRVGVVRTDLCVFFDGIDPCRSNDVGNRDADLMIALEDEPTFGNFHLLFTCLDDPTCPLSLTINGTPYHLNVHPWTTLLDLLRCDLELTGPKKGCDHGQCGACTVLIDGERMNSCLKLALTLDGADVTTVEGLGTPDRMHIRCNKPSSSMTPSNAAIACQARSVRPSAF